MKKHKSFSIVLLIASFLLYGFTFKKDNIFSITSFGAIGDGETMNTKYIQSAIDKCASEGGGTVVIPKGIFLSGSIFIKQDVNLFIAKEGVLKGSVNYDDYPQINTRWEGEEKPWLACLVNAIGLKGTKLSGEGTIDGSGDVWTERANLQRQQLSSTQVRWRGKPRLIGFQNCKDVEISNLRLNNQASWGLFILYSKDVQIKNLKITAEHNIPSSDGIDIDSSNGVHVTGCDIDVNDDCISIKAGKDEDGLRVNRPSENILIEKTRFGYGHGGVAMGSETSGGIRNVMIRNCLFEAENWAPIRFKSQPSRGGVVENITYKNLTLKGTRKAFEFNMAWRMVNPKPPAKVLPIVRNVRIINVSGTTKSVGDMRGLPDSPIQKVKFKNCTLTAEQGFTIENARDINIKGLKIIGLDGDAIKKVNVH
jgi:exo-poly-alpha-galacturonosidase